MKAEIITIGDEILLGQIVDTNSAWIAQSLFSMHIQVRQITSITDDENHILFALSEASRYADIIICTGGLGPTNDDVTKKTAAIFFNTTLIHNDEVLEHVKGIFQRLNRTMPDMNNTQAEILSNAQVLFNDWGTAPGMWVEHQGKIYIFLPGVPFEMKNLMSHRVMPKLNLLHSEEKVINRHILTVGLGESHLAEQLVDFENDLPKNAHLAYLPKIGLVKLRLTLQGNNIKQLDLQGDELQSKLMKRIGPAVVSTNDISFEQVIVAKFKENNCTLSTAESCTGGNIAKQITEVNGASQIFLGSIVAYSNQVKIDLLNVERSVLETKGAVSEETVIQMAKQAQRKLGSTYAIATSGIAGPTGGTEEKPVGTIWIAVAGKKHIKTKLFKFQNDRVLNIERSTTQALLLLWNLFQQELEN